MDVQQEDPDEDGPEQDMDGMEVQPRHAGADIDSDDEVPILSMMVINSVVGKRKTAYDGICEEDEGCCTLIRWRMPDVEDGIDGQLCAKTACTWEPQAEEPITLDKDELVQQRITMQCGSHTFPALIDRHTEGDSTSESPRHCCNSHLIGTKFFIIFDGPKADKEFDLSLSAPWQSRLQCMGARGPF